MCNVHVHNKPADWIPSLSVTNCIVYGNSNSKNTFEDIKTSDRVSATISNSIFGGGLEGFRDGGENQIGIDPMLNPLADNGGSTKTFALRPESPAIDAGKSTGDSPQFDQRGSPFSRHIGDSPDIGAYEFSVESGQDPLDRN
jgi:hypothetical protein